MTTLALEIAKLALAPGDVLVVKVDDMLSKEMVQAIKDNMRRVVGPDMRILILPKGFSLAVLTKAEVEEMVAA